MPLGLTRLNERHQRPNPLINFLQPHASSPSPTRSQHTLSLVAAQCYPIMRAAHLSVMTLEEFPPNAEFLGRNFNAGEVIQLVLRERGTGRWLSLRAVVLVMMHELAHCVHMNHSRDFWRVRDEYVTSVRGLWAKGYTGEGMWGRGRGLEDGNGGREGEEAGVEGVGALCGGSMRRWKRGKKRQRGSGGEGGPTYAERQQKRIARKFGVHGEGAVVGGDELVRGALETRASGKRGTGTPKVAGSKRGRELRAAAAIVRFEAAKRQRVEGSGTMEGAAAQSDSETAEEEGEDDDDGVTIKHEDGYDMIDVCSGAAHEEEAVAADRELDELRTLSPARPNPLPSTSPSPSTSTSKPPSPQSPHPALSRVPSPLPPAKPPQPPSAASAASAAINPCPEAPPPTTCPICTLALPASPGPTCPACAHVVFPALLPRSWMCGETHCREVGYLNARDAGRCGLCGARKEVREEDGGTQGVGEQENRESRTRSTAPAATQGRGLVPGEIWRWE